MQFRQRFGCFDAQAVQIEIFCILATFKQPLRLAAGFRANRTQRHPNTSIFPEALGAKKSDTANRRPSRWRGKVNRSNSRVGTAAPGCPAELTLGSRAAVPAPQEPGSYTTTSFPSAWAGK